MLRYPWKATERQVNGLGLLNKEHIIDTFAARDIKCPRQQNPVDSLSEYSAHEEYGVELHRRRRKRTEYIIL